MILKSQLLNCVWTLQIVLHMFVLNTGDAVDKTKMSFLSLIGSLIHNMLLNVIHQKKILTSKYGRETVVFD